MGRIMPVIHNVSSVQRLTDMARLVYGMGYRSLIVTKAYGGAAQNGVPEAYRIALKYNASLIVLPDLKDAVEYLSPGEVLLVSSEDPEELVEPCRGVSGDVMIVFNGGEQGFSPAEERLGRKIYIAGAPARLGPLAEAALILYKSS